MSSSRRNSLLLALASFGAAYLFFANESFWGVVCMVLIGVWALITLLPIMDAIWRFKVGMVVSVAGLTLVVLWPSLSSATGGKVPVPAYVRDGISFGIARGLDLQGGMRLVYTVEVEEAIRDKRENFANDMRQELAVVFGIHSGDGLISRDERAKLDDRVKISMPENSAVRLKFKDKGEISKIDERFQKRFSAELSQTRGPADDEVTFRIRNEVETTIRERAVTQAKDTINRRIDERGLREASVTVRDEDIIVEVPGENAKAFDDIKEIIRQTARLEFKMVDDEGDFFGKIKDEQIPEGEGISVYQQSAPAGPGKTALTHPVRIVKRDNETMQETLARAKKWVATLGVPDDHEIGFEELPPDPETKKEQGWTTLYLYSRAEVTGDYITDAMVAQEQGGQSLGQYYVAITFSPAGADRFEEITGANIQRRFAIILDGTVKSAPVIKTKIGGGRASITMGAGDPGKQLDDAGKLELVLRSGALPAPIAPSNESMIGPSLGKDAIGQALKGGLVGSSLVLFFMAIYYRKSGLVADLCVVFNFLLQLAVLASFSATMTLPGIAGLTLTIGMSVDVNVLINERIREELRAGRSIRAAVEAGYEKAWPSILDGHVTVFISGLILAQYGTGPVKGFAIALLVGIGASLFTGVFVTRLFFDWWVRGAKVKRLSVGAEF